MHAMNPTGLPADYISQFELKTFCKNAEHLRLVSGGRTPSCPTCGVGAHTALGPAPPHAMPVEPVHLSYWLSAAVYSFLTFSTATHANAFNHPLVLPQIRTRSLAEEFTAFSASSIEYHLEDPTSDPMWWGQYSACRAWR